MWGGGRGGGQHTDCTNELLLNATRLEAIAVRLEAIAIKHLQLKDPTPQTHMHSGSVSMGCLKVRQASLMKLLTSSWLHLLGLEPPSAIV